MAVVRILKGSSSFSALDYNQERIVNGEAEFLVQRNFPYMKPNSFDPGLAKQYLSSWSAVNTRAKMSQFHVSISVKGRTFGKRELQAIGERWLELMGYANNPYCIFFHRNTRNNHIHIVTTRIDKNGQKINHNFDKSRAVKTLDMIMGADKTKDSRNSVASYLRFSYANKNQFLSLLENNHFVVRPSDDTDEVKYVVFKNGQSICELSERLILWAAARYAKSLSNDRKKHIRSLLIRYANKVSSFQSMNELLRKHHGFSIVLYGGTDGKAYYGYSVIDYRDRCVYKGSEFANIRFLSSIIQQRPPSYKEAEFLVKSLIGNNPKITTKELNKQTIRHAGFYLNKEGLIVTGSNMVVGELNESLLDKLRYNDILKFCNEMYHPVTEGERNWVAAHYHINSDDLIFYSDENGSIRDEDIHFYENTIQSMLDDGDIKRSFDESGYTYSKHNGEYVFYDEDRRAIFSADLLSDDLSDEVYRSLDYRPSSVFPGVVDDDSNLIETSVGAISGALDVLSVGDVHISVGGGTNGDKKRRKRNNIR